MDEQDPFNLGQIPSMPYGLPPYPPIPPLSTRTAQSLGLPSPQQQQQQPQQQQQQQQQEQQFAYQQQQRLAYQQQQLQQRLHQQLQNVWINQYQEIEQTSDFKNHSIPLARIKKIMKADEEVKMISAEAPVIFARACEMFILELTLRSWSHTEENRRRILLKNDIAAAITRTEVFDFLAEIVPKEDINEEVGPSSIPTGGGGGGGVGVSLPVVGPSDGGIPYCHMPAPPFDGSSGGYVYLSQRRPTYFHQLWMRKGDGIMREAAKNGMRSGLVVIGALAFGYLTLQLGFKPYLEKAQLHNSDNNLNPQSDHQQLQHNQEHEQENDSINDTAAIVLDDGSPS